MIKPYKYLFFFRPLDRLGELYVFSRVEFYALDLVCSSVYTVSIEI